MFSTPFRHLARSDLYDPRQGGVLARIHSLYLGRPALSRFFCDNQQPCPPCLPSCRQREIGKWRFRAFPSTNNSALRTHDPWRRGHAYNPDCALQVGPGAAPRRPLLPLSPLNTWCHAARAHCSSTGSPSSAAFSARFLLLLRFLLQRSLPSELSAPEGGCTPSGAACVSSALLAFKAAAMFQKSSLSAERMGCQAPPWQGSERSHCGG